MRRMKVEVPGAIVGYCPPLSDVRRTLEAYGVAAERWARFFPGRDERAVVNVFLDFIRRHEDCLLRSCLPGHLTGAALVTGFRDGRRRVLLTHHRKLDRWLQLGGHADGDADLARVAKKEAQEESGIRNLDLLAHPWLRDREGLPVPFDLDVHEIPAHRNDPPHLHFDVRYVIVVADDAPVVVSEESHDVRWFTLDEARAVTNEESMYRQFAKLDVLHREADG